MSFLYPSLLWLLVPLGILLWNSQRHIHHRVHLVILMLLVLALARPTEKHALQEVAVQAKDIIIALDVSRSMQAMDLAPTRYDFAKKTIKVLLNQNPSDNIMLIAFTSNPLILSPPTTDHALVNIALESLNPEYILTKGTSLQALFTKLNAMPLEDKHLILMTDGGEEKDLKALSPMILDAGVFLHVLALGSTQGSTVKSKEGKTLKDKQGNLVISRINPILEHLAHATNGSYQLASSTPKETAQRLNETINTLHKKTQSVQKMQYRYKEWYQLPLALALLLFLLLHTKGVKYLLLLFIFLGIPVQASIFDLYHLHQAYEHYENKAYTKTKAQLKKIEEPTLQSQLLLANTYYKQGDFKHAISIYKSIATRSVRIKQILYYNIATAYANLEAYDKAKVYYTKTLQLDKDDDALYNLHLIAFLNDKKDANLGIAHPKSQSSNSSQSEHETKEKDKTAKEDKPSSGSKGGGENSTKKEKPSTLTLDDKQNKQPLSSKVYDLINKGYIRETKPW